MKQPIPNPFFVQEESSLDIKQEVLKYLRFWPYFVICLIFCLVGSYFYLRYAPKIFQTNAKIKILDDNKGLELPSSAFVFNRSNINLENEVEVLKSYRILEKVVQDLDLNSVKFEVGNIQTSQIDTFPFAYKRILPNTNLKRSFNFSIKVDQDKFSVINLSTDEEVEIPDHNSYLLDHNLPFQIQIEDSLQRIKSLNKQFTLSIKPTRNAVQGLKGNLGVETIGEQSDLLRLSLKGESYSLSERIINAVIETFNNDGIKDRQLVSKRTLDFIDDRFEFLAQELDSIESDKKDFKQDNKLVYLESDTELSIKQQSQAEEEVFKIENQLAVTELINEALRNDTSYSELLPANIGIENSNVNALISDYNTTVLEKDKLVSGGGENNPTVQLLNSKLRDLRSNIDRSLSNYRKQLQLSLQQLRARNIKFRNQVSSLPEKEKLLRAIERQQKIKESLYLLLLQKREEAAINLAITEPSIKVVEYALSTSGPISPKPRIAYIVAILGGLLIPFGIFYIIFLLDTKVHSKKDIEDLVSDIPVAAEIPRIKDKNKIIFSNPNDRSSLAESFRILSANVNYILPQEDRGKVVFCTSTIKGEGKTFISLNLSLALASLNKKVLLVGADLRNPQLHNYIDMDKSGVGLSNYLHDLKIDWKHHLIKGFERHPSHDILISGSLPPNPAHLLTNGRFEALLEEAKTMYDYIIVDTAPTILVTDTLLITKLADATLYITRANFTEKNLLDHSIELHKNKKIKNLAYVINSVGSSNRSYGYNYGYSYGYGEAES